MQARPHSLLISRTGSRICSSGLVLAKGLVGPKQNTFVMQVCNPLEEVVELHKGMSMGTLIPAEVVDMSGSVDLEQRWC